MFSLFRKSKPISSDFRYSQADFDAMMMGAVLMAHELELLILEGRKIAQRLSENQPTTADVLSLIETLKGAKLRWPRI
jgi:hypothetical protein